MDFIKKVWDKIKSPKGWKLALFYVVFVIVITGTLLQVIFRTEMNFLHYILFTVSAFMLAYFVYTIVIFSPKWKGSFINTLKRFKFTNTMLESYGFRTIIFAIISFIINISFVVFQGVLAILTKSAWYMSITIYYLVLSMMKGLVLYSKKHNGNNAEKSFHTYRDCGVMLIPLTFALSGIVVLIYTSNMYFEYAGLMIYAAAAFTFYKLTLAIINIFKARKQDDMYVQTIRNINLCSALVSIIVLQVAMFQAFSPENNTSFANGLTGGAVSIAMLGVAIVMVIRAKKILSGEVEFQTDVAEQNNSENLLSSNDKRESNNKELLGEENSINIDVDNDKKNEDF